VNHRDRRHSQARDPFSAQRIRELQHQVERTGLPGILHGLTGACRDCTADGAFLLLPGRQVIVNIFHDTGCPAAAGVTEWETCGIDDQMPEATP
jgi:hypothetical protein